MEIGRPATGRPIFSSWTDPVFIFFNTQLRIALRHAAMDIRREPRNLILTDKVIPHSVILWGALQRWVASSPWFILRKPLSRQSRYFCKSLTMRQLFLGRCSRPNRTTAHIKRSRLLVGTEVISAVLRQTATHSLNKLDSSNSCHNIYLNNLLLKFRKYDKGVNFM